MYLKSIEIHGFKSFANKIVFEFHNGITGIVGPNGSGKSNVGDAVRWVLGEQSAKQLRGSSMQDIIFAGTENRKPLSYAYVAITLDNSDHVLPIDFQEVTVARRVYRSGESEYLINGSPCRLKDVNELFYDTGIGKEGYSIIGQGQIDRILSGKPEERRELFDEAAGIVKFKRRKSTAQKKLQDERENLVRVNDILAELERQVGPLEKQAQKARIYLQKKEDLKTYDVNMFLMELENIEGQLSEIQKNYQIADDNLKEHTKKYDQIKVEYDQMEELLKSLDEEIEQIRSEMNTSDVTKKELEGKIRLIEEQINSSQTSEEHYQSRLQSIEKERNQKLEEKKTCEEQKNNLEKQLHEVEHARMKAEADLKKIQAEIASFNAGMEKGRSEIIEILNNKSSIEGREKACEAELNQLNIRKAELTSRLLTRKTEEEDFKNSYRSLEEKYQEARDLITVSESKIKEIKEKQKDWKKKRDEANRKLNEELASYHKNQSRLESLQNIAERYDGYGNSIRKVMEQKNEHPGLLGVVADLIKVDQKYETAVETALGGNIQNIVTEDESTAKEMIRFLKEHRYGRATFLPLTSVSGKDQSKNEKFLEEEGAIGFANTLVNAEEKYQGVLAYLLGRVIVVDKIDHALAIAKKSHYSLHLVSLEGEYLSPGGSIAGGAFKNNSNSRFLPSKLELFLKAPPAMEPPGLKYSPSKETRCRE